MAVTSSSSRRIAAKMPAIAAGGFGLNPALSSCAGGPPGGYPEAPKLCAITRAPPIFCTAASRFAVPSVRSRLVTAKYRSNLRMLAPIVDSAVAWYTTTSGRAAMSADSVAAASRTSMTSGSAPAAVSPPAFETVVVVAVTSWPAPTSIGSSCRPTTPVAPMTKIRISCAPHRWTGPYGSQRR